MMGHLRFETLVYMYIAEILAELCALAESDFERRFTQLTSVGMCRRAWMTLFR